MSKQTDTFNKPTDITLAAKLSEILQQLSDEGYDNHQIAKLFTTGFHLVHQHDVQLKMDERTLLRRYDA